MLTTKSKESKGNKMSSIEALRNEIISLENELKEAERNNNEERILYLEERIKRVEIEITNKMNYKDYFD